MNGPSKPQASSGRRRLSALRRRLVLIAVLVTAGGGAVGLWRARLYARWRRELTGAGFADELAVPDEGTTILIIAPHPDDEVLGCGGLIAAAVSAGADVRVAILTNGDASELALIFGEKDLPLTPRAFIKLGRQRQNESLEALASLGLPPDHVYFLSYPNNGLVALWRPEHWTRAHVYTSPFTKANRSPYPRSFTPAAAYCGQQVVSDLTRLMRMLKPAAIFVTHPQDMHPDHWAAERFTQYALLKLRQAGEPWAARAAVYGYLIHWPRWPLPRAYGPRLALDPPPELLATDGRPWLRLPLDDALVRRKAAALWRYRSQQPRADRLLSSLVRANEAFCRLSPPEGEPWAPRLDRWLFWADETEVSRKLGGADISAVYLRLATGGTLTANVICAPRPLSRRAYVALDVRGWDRRGRAAITTVYLRREAAMAVRCLGAELSTTAAPASMSAQGLWTVGPVRLPSLASSTLLVSCWGSIADRRTDPAHWPGPAAERFQPDAPLLRQWRPVTPRSNDTIRPTQWQPLPSAPRTRAAWP